MMPACASTIVRKLCRSWAHRGTPGINHADGQLDGCEASQCCCLRVKLRAGTKRFMRTSGVAVLQINVPAERSSSGGARVCDRAALAQQHQHSSIGTPWPHQFSSLQRQDGPGLCCGGSRTSISAAALLKTERQLVYLVNQLGSCPNKQLRRWMDALRSPLRGVALPSGPVREELAEGGPGHGTMDETFPFFCTFLHHLLIHS